ncbi:MAG: tetratricopeptide repeat protein [Fulvivirga sp.]
MKHSLLAVAIIAALSSCNDKPQKYTEPELEPQVVSLLGITYFEPVRSEEVQQRLENNLTKAKNKFEEEPSEMNYIWFGRRTAYLTRYYNAIEIFTEGLEKYPDSYKLLRHRGHRYISVRDFDKAIADLQKAAELMPKDTLEIEPDGIPNKINKPLSSTQFNVWYHLALAHYLKGDFEKANEVYAKCMQTSVNDDLVCATADWQYMTLRRLGQDQKADSVLQLVSADMEIVENDSYHKRLMMYKGNLVADSLLSVSDDNPDQDLAIATQGYGVGNWYLYNGDTTKAIEIYEQVIGGKHWSAFGFIAAEADLYNLE